MGDLLVIDTGAVQDEQPVVVGHIGPEKNYPTL
jgi:hypothetical protein